MNDSPPMHAVLDEDERSVAEALGAALAIHSRKLSRTMRETILRDVNRFRGDSDPSFAERANRFLTRRSSLEDVDLGRRLNGYLVRVHEAGVDPGGLPVDAAWAVVAATPEEAVSIMSQRQPAPKNGFKVIAALSQAAVAALDLGPGEARPV